MSTPEAAPWPDRSDEPIEPETSEGPGGQLVDLDPVWRALSDPTRRAILDVLREGPQNTGALCARFDHLSRHGVIKHLKALDRANLVTVTVRGRERINHLNVVPIQQIYERWMRPYESYWATRLQRLAEEVARERSANSAQMASPKGSKTPGGTGQSPIPPAEPLTRRRSNG